MKECLCCYNEKKESLQTCTNVKCSYEICHACIVQLRKKGVCPHCQQPSHYTTAIEKKKKRHRIPYRHSFYLWVWGYIFFMTIQGEKLFNISLPSSDISSHILYGFIGNGIFFSVILCGSVWYNFTIWHNLLNSVL